MKDAKILLIINNVDIELAKKIQKLINEHNAERKKLLDNDRKKKED